MHKLFKVNQSAIIVDQSRRVLILKGPAGWELPGGRLEDDTTWQEGLTREIREETGIQKVESLKVVDIILSDSQETYMVYFVCKISGESVTVQLSNEHEEYAWIDVAAVDNYQFTHPKTKEKIRLAWNLFCGEVA